MWRLDLQHSLLLVQDDPKKAPDPFHHLILEQQQPPQAVLLLGGRIGGIDVEHVKAFELGPTCGRKRRTRMDSRFPVDN
jgi:hypothetical protein